MEISRSGCSIPLWIKRGGRRALHSTIDPVREGVRFFQAHKAEGFLVFFGMGGGYHIEPFLSGRSISSLMIVEPVQSEFLSYLSFFDAAPLITDPRVEFIVGHEAEECAERIFSEYFPAVSGDFTVIPFRPLVELHTEYYQELSQCIQNLLDHTASDYTVQTTFGKRWFSNAVRNLPMVEKTSWMLPPSRKVLITGAGPSLEDQVDLIRKERSGGFLLATDTSFPALIQRGIVPDAVISLDCQHISYRHFLGYIPEDVILVLELSSPPTIARKAKRFCFFGSPNPFAGYVSSRFRGMPILDTSGGNVSHTAISLAGQLGAEQIYLFGMDFSYPEGKTYARGTYIYPSFSLTENRLLPLESSAFSFLIRSPKTVRVQTSYGYRYETPQLSGYRDRLEEFLPTVNVEVIPAPGKGLSIRSQHRNILRKSTRREIPHPQTSIGAKEFLRSYEEALSAIPQPDISFAGYLSRLSYEEREIVSTILPLCAYFRSHLKESPQLAEIIETARSWALTFIRSVL
jgi:hypothetical protein